LNFAHSGALSDRGNAGLFHTYSAWVRTNGADVPYLDAFAFFQQYRHSSACTGSCSTDVATIDGQARFQFATQRAKLGDYGTAVIQLEYIQSADASSPYASQAHSIAPPLYYEYGQQQIAGQYYIAYGNDYTASPGCDLAVEAYKTLVKEYSSSPEAKKATAALAASQNVSGTILHYPTGLATTVSLSKNAYAPPCCAPVTGGYYFSQDYSTSLNTGNGSYVFHSVPQGSYHISVRASDGSMTWWYVGTSGTLTGIPVLPLCPTHVVDLDEKGS
jgi:hypothetical protein